MAAMTTVDRVAAGAAFQADASLQRASLGAVTKADVQAAIAAVDDWLVANQPSFNLAIPLAVRTALSAAQKAELLVYVVKKRYETGA